MKFFSANIKYSFLGVLLFTLLVNTEVKNPLNYYSHQAENITGNPASLSTGDSILYVVTYMKRGLNIPILSLYWSRDTIFSTLPQNARVLDVNVTIDTIIHTWDDAVEVHIKKSAVNETIISHVGGGGDNFLNTILDDSASQSISSGSPPFVGRWRPSSPALLGHFNLQAVTGAWILELSSISGGDTGQLRAWTLTIVYDLISGQQNNNEIIPDKFILNQNYPNPFNPSTSITYGLPKMELVKISIYNINGEEVMTFNERFKPPGTHKIFIDGYNLPSGVYFYKFTAGEFTDTKKMILIK